MQIKSKINKLKLSIVLYFVLALLGVNMYMLSMLSLVCRVLGRILAYINVKCHYVTLVYRAIMFSVAA